MESVPRRGSGRIESGANRQGKLDRKDRRGPPPEAGPPTSRAQRNLYPTDDLVRDALDRTTTGSRSSAGDGTAVFLACGSRNLAAVVDDLSDDSRVGRAGELLTRVVVRAVWNAIAVEVPSALTALGSVSIQPADSLFAVGWSGVEPGVGPRLGCEEIGRSIESDPVAIGLPPGSWVIALAGQASGGRTDNVLTPALNDYAAAVLHNSFGRYQTALVAAQRACDQGDSSLVVWALGTIGRSS